MDHDGGEGGRERVVALIPLHLPPEAPAVVREAVVDHQRRGLLAIPPDLVGEAHLETVDPVHVGRGPVAVGALSEGGSDPDAPHDPGGGLDGHRRAGAAGPVVEAVGRNDGSASGGDDEEQHGGDTPLWRTFLSHDGKPIQALTRRF